MGGGSEVLVIEVNNDISESDRPYHGEQPSGELLRSGRIQRYADSGGKVWQTTE